MIARITLLTTVVLLITGCPGADQPGKEQPGTDDGEQQENKPEEPPPKPDVKPIGERAQAADGATAARKPDALDEALALVGMRRGDLGWEPKGWWPRFPRVPYKLDAFDALFAEPLDGATYARALGETAKTHLDPETLDNAEAMGAGQLFQAAQRLGVDPRFGGFRGYNANLIAEPTPLAEAILELTRRAGRPTKYVTFGMESPYPKPVEALAAETEAIPEELSKILGQLVLEVAEAHRWAELAFRKVDAADRVAVAGRTNLGEELIDALDYAPEVDDVARAWDEASLWYAGLKSVEALDRARQQIAALEDVEAPADLAFDWETPWGWIRVRGSGDDTVDGTDALLVVDLGGNDIYRGGVAASTATRPLGLLLDTGGDDRYESEVPAQGAGLAGAGVLIDAAGNDVYQARHYAQGVGQFGMGLLADLSGDDKYTDNFSGQGCGYFGIGLLFDAAGRDEYTLWAEGQGLGGGGGGVGVLADHGGDDRYTAVREHSVTGRPSYHSPEEDIAVSNAQGCGMGRRGDGADGHSWAGGLGALLDGGGDDVYTAGNWSMGTGYWFGIGVLHDGEGNDEYHGVTWSQGTGAHFCIGLFVDEQGDDKHLAEGNSRLSLAWAHDFTIGMLLDVEGDDVYSVNEDGLGGSINRSVALLIDTGGDDVYRTEKIPYPGHAKVSDQFRSRPGVNFYFADTSSVGLFLDIGGDDTYWGELKDDSSWLDPEDSPNWQDRNFSIGVDRPDGAVDLTPIPSRPLSGSCRR
jgi:hypothetical protein